MTLSADLPGAPSMFSRGFLRMLAKEDITDEVIDISVRTGDILALVSPGSVTADVAERLTAELQRIVPDTTKVLIIPQGMTLAKITVREPGRE